MRKLKNATERLFWIAGCFAVLALPGAAETRPATFEWNETDLRAEWGGFKRESAAMVTPSARVISACHSCGIDSEVYSRVLYYRCNSDYSHVTDTGAKDIAERAAKGSIKVDVFLDVYYRTCNFASAVEVACR